MYEIIANMNTKSDLFAFLEKTQNFSKKFYQCYSGSTYMINEDEEIPILYVVAIAISRNLTYILHWEIPYERHIDCDKYVHGDTNYAHLEADGRFPTKNAIPYKYQDKTLFYPYLTLEEANRPYENVFAGHEFTQVNAIHKDGEELV